MSKKKIALGCIGASVAGCLGMAVLGAFMGEPPKSDPEELSAESVPEPEPTQEVAEKAEPEPEPQPDPKPRLVGDDGEVHAEAFEAHGLEWPLVVQEGKVRCEPGLIASFIAPDGETYALNGIAKSRYKEIRPIWADNPEIEGTKIRISDMIEVALQLCERSL